MLKVIKNLGKLIVSFIRMADELDHENILIGNTSHIIFLMSRNPYLSSLAILEMLFNCILMNMDSDHKISTRCNGKLLLILLHLFQFYKKISFPCFLGLS